MKLFENEKNVEVVELRQWLDWASGEDRGELLVLPMIQRGSVWRPEQIVNLWDTLLRGMPIGSLMVNSVRKGTEILLIGKKSKAAEPLERDGFSLLDGQQRTLSMLVAWPSSVSMDRRLWIDFADEPGAGHNFRLRVTTENQKFGFKRQSPSSKLPLDERRKAIWVYEAAYGEDATPDFRNTCPYTNGHSLPLDLKVLIQWWCDFKNRDVWRKYVEEELKKIKKWRPISKNEINDPKKYAKYCVWEELDQETRNRACSYIDALASALKKLFSLQVPLIKVDDEIFASADDSLEPPLAVLFQRIGAGGTPLTNADYAYSVIKHLHPKTYKLVESLHSEGNISTTLTATDLVMTALRLAMAKEDDNGKKFTDLVNPNKQQFHSLLKQGGDEFIATFTALIDENGLKETFEKLENILSYKTESNPIGLPLLAFPLLGRPLLQVLLRWGVRQHAGASINSSRMDILRFALYWIMWVKDPDKASLIAFRVIKESALELFPAKPIYEKLVDEGVAYKLVSPKQLKTVPSLHLSPVSTEKPLRGWSGRFHVDGEKDVDYQNSRKFYARWWNKSYSSHIHPVLLWLQRDYVATFDAKMLAGREEETPYDYDHICPSSHWSGRGAGIFEYCDDGQAHWQVGNSIGNLRVWDSSKNRIDGDGSPKVKLKLENDTSGPHTQNDLLSCSAIPTDQEEHKHAWLNCSRDGDSKRIWDADRASAFQKAVELRTFHLYERYFNELDFDIWIDSTIAEVPS